MRTLRSKRELALVALAALVAWFPNHPGIGAPSISYLRVGASPDCPHIYASTANYSTFPTNVSVSPGALVFFTVSANGSPPLSFQWRMNGQDIVGTGCGGVPFCSYESGCTYGYPGVELSPGDYSVVVTDGFGLSTTSRVVTLSIDPTFRKINAANGSAGSTDQIVTDTGWSACCSWADYDGDGYPDCFVGNGLDGHPDTSALYHNNGDGTFTRVYPSAFATPIIQSSTPCWGDYDNDGKPDLFVLALDSTPTGPTGGALLFHNDGGGEFTRLPSGIVIPSTNTWGGAWTDYDQDGFLDLFVTTLDHNALSHCFLFHNNRDGTFTSITNSPLASDVGSATACAWVDYDNDGRIDVFVSGGRAITPAANRLYHHEADGTFTRVTNTSVGSIVTDPGYSGSCAWGDYDNSGSPSLFVLNINGLVPFLYHNNGNGTFIRVTNPIVVGGPSGWFDTGNNPFTCAWGDYDNDGFLDLFVTDEGGAAPFVNFLYHNNGDGTFTKVTTGSPVGEYSDSLGCSWVDYDNDGFLDLFAIRGDRRGNALYQNNLPNAGNTNAWLKVRLVGTVSNRSAIGAKVRVKAFYRGQSRWQLRQISSGIGIHGHDELEAHFGLGDATNADTVRIEWPSGTVQEFHNVAPRQILTYTEPPRLLASATTGVPQFSLKGGRFMQYDILASSDLAAWSPIGTVTVTNMSGTAQIIDSGAPSSDRRFYRAVSH